MEAWVRKYLLGTAIVIGMAASTTVTATTVNYSILLDSQGNISDGTGQGYNSQWYYYASSNRYIMWFHTSGYDESLVGEINYYAKIQAAIVGQQSTYDIRVGWTTAAWNNNQTWNPASTPPLPHFADSLSLESKYFTTYVFKSLNGLWDLGDGYTDNALSKKVKDFNPEWVYISFKGKNIKVERYVNFQATEPQEEPPPADRIGACCNYINGDSYPTTNGACFSGYVYLGDDTGPDDCSAENFIWDYGDAPATYGVLKADNGARHTVVSGVKLGSTVSPDADGKPGAGANLDNFDDGVQFTTSLTAGQTARVKITASTLGSINAWLDLNLDGDWTDFGEQILLDEPVVAGTNNVSFFIPATATAGQSYIRFRFNTTGGLSFVGTASDGEVEDYAVTIVAGSSTNPNPDPDTNPSPDITPVSPTSALSTLWHQPVTQVENNFVFGWNIPTNYDFVPMIADDWRSKGLQPIQGFRFWGAFENWVFSSMPTNLPTAFHIAIWSNNSSTNKPQKLIWETACTSWAWAYTGQIQDAQAQIGGEAVFEFTCLLSQDEWFTPTSSTITTYWVSITPLYEAGVSPTPWGWVTRQMGNTNPAIQIQTTTAPNTTVIGPWPPTPGSQYVGGVNVVYPSGVGWDMAFDLITQGGGAGGGVTTDSDLANAIGDQNNDGIINADDLYLLINLMLTP